MKIYSFEISKLVYYAKDKEIQEVIFSKLYYGDIVKNYDAPATNTPGPQKIASVVEHLYQKKMIRVLFSVSLLPHQNFFLQKTPKIQQCKKKSDKPESTIPKVKIKPIDKKPQQAS